MADEERGKKLEMEILSLIYYHEIAGVSEEGFPSAAALAQQIVNLCADALRPAPSVAGVTESSTAADVEVGPVESDLDRNFRSGFVYGYQLAMARATEDVRIGGWVAEANEALRECFPNDAPSPEQPSVDPTGDEE